MHPLKMPDGGAMTPRDDEESLPTFALVTSYPYEVSRDMSAPGADDMGIAHDLCEVEVRPDNSISGDGVHA